MARCTIGSAAKKWPCVSLVHSEAVLSSFGVRNLGVGWFDGYRHRRRLSFRPRNSRFGPQAKCGVKRTIFEAEGRFDALIKCAQRYDRKKGNDFRPTIIACGVPV